MAPLIPVFCVENISTEILHQLLDEITEFLDDSPEIGEADPEEVHVLTTQDLTTLKSATGTTSSIPPFQSPFRGMTVEQICRWSSENLAQLGSFMGSTMLILDSQTIKDRTCLLVCVFDDYQPPQTLRYDFYNAYFGAQMFIYQSWSLDWYLREDMYRRSKIALTKESRNRNKMGLILVNGALEATEDANIIEDWPREEDKS